MYLRDWYMYLALSVVHTADCVNFVVNYPVKLLQPVTGTSFSGDVDKHYLTCFGNQDYRPATFLEGIYCMSGATWIYPLYSCQSLWGSRSVSVSVDGSVEIFRMEKLPRESSHTYLNASHWLHLDSKRGTYSHEIVNVEATPVYLCVRSNDWQDQHNHSRFALHFRSAYIRGRDRTACIRKMLSEASFLLGMSVSWLCPLLKAYWAATFSYQYGLNIFIAIVSLSVTTLLLTPFVLTRKNREIARYSYKLYFSFIKPPNEIELDYRRAWLLFHAFYFSSVLVCSGCAATYIAFAYFGFNRELRNDLLRASLAMSATALTYFASRVFDRSSHNITWIATVWSTAAAIRSFINKTSRDEVTFAVIVISFLIQALIHRVMNIPIVIRIVDVFYQEMKSLRVDIFSRVFTGSSFVSEDDLLLTSSLLSPRSSSASSVTSPTATTPVQRPGLVSVSNYDIEVKSSLALRHKDSSTCTVTIQDTYILLGPVLVQSRPIPVVLHIGAQQSSSEFRGVQSFFQTSEFRVSAALCNDSEVSCDASGQVVFCSRKFEESISSHKNRDVSLRDVDSKDQRSTGDDNQKVSETASSSRKRKKKKQIQIGAMSEDSRAEKPMSIDMTAGKGLSSGILPSKQFDFTFSLRDLAAMELFLSALQSTSISRGQSKVFQASDLVIEMCRTLRDKGVFVSKLFVSFIDRLDVTLSFILSSNSDSGSNRNSHLRCIADTVIANVPGLSTAELVSVSDERSKLQSLQLLALSSLFGLFTQIVYTGVCDQHAWLEDVWVASSDVSISTIISINNFRQQQRIFQRQKHSWLSTQMLRACAVLGINDRVAMAAVTATVNMRVHFEERNAECVRATDEGLVILPPMLAFSFVLDYKEVVDSLFRLSEKEYRGIAIRLSEFESNIGPMNRCETLDCVMQYISMTAIALYVHSLLNDYRFQLH